MKAHFAFLLAAATPCIAADLFTAAGTVINAQTGSPLPRAQVYIFAPNSAKPMVKTTTGDDGHFSFDLPPGSYLLRAGTRSNSQVYGARNPDIPLGSALIVGPGLDTSHVTFRWYPPSAIYGRVVDEAGEGVEGAMVQLVRSSIIGGRRRYLTVAFDRTNDLGEYRFGFLPGGARYYLAVTGKPWYAPRILLGPGIKSEEPSVAFVPAYYPNTPDPSQAAPVALHTGEEFRADFALKPVAGAMVSVKHDAPAGTKGTVQLVSAGIAGNNSFQDPTGLFEQPVPGLEPRFTDVPPGHYTVEITATNGSADLSGRASVDVNGSDVTVDVAMHPMATVSGTVRFKTDAGPRGQPTVTLVPEGNSASFGAAVRPDGSFVFPRVPNGRYRARLTAAGFFAEAVAVTGVEFRNGVLDLSEGDSATLSITVSDEAGGVKGFVMNGDQPADAVLAILVPAAESDDPASYRGYQTESDGSFDFRNIPAGRYFLFAVDDTAFEYANPAVIRPYLASAKPVTIEAHGSSTERIPLTSPIPQ